jgi:hypothetical protein
MVENIPRIHAERQVIAMFATLARAAHAATASEPTSSASTASAATTSATPGTSTAGRPGELRRSEAPRLTNAKVQADEGRPSASIPFNQV